MDYTLVVVDMQPSFESANHRRVVSNVKREIKKAISCCAAIVVLEYRGHGPTNQTIVKMVRSYNRGFFATKTRDDGSDELMGIITTHQLPTSFRVVGINYGACVKSTITGLITMKQNDIIVIEDACHQPIRWNKIGGYSWSQVRNQLENYCNVGVENQLTRR